MIAEIEKYKENLKELYNFQSFDWDTMPESARQKAHELLMEWIEEQFKLLK